MHILIYEPDHRGHRLTTVSVLISALLKVRDELERSSLPTRIRSVTLATTASALKSDAYAEQLAPLSDHFVVRQVPEIGIGGNAVMRTLRRAQGLRIAMKDDSINHVYLPYADGILQLLALSRLVPGSRIIRPQTTCEALIMQNSYAYPNTTRIQRLRATLGIRFCGCERVHVNDPLAWNYLQQHHHQGLDHVRLIPDPITDTPRHDKRRARAALDLPLEARIVGTVGVINSRKGADVLVKAFVRANLQASDRLLLAGKFTPDISRLVEEANDSRIICMDRYLSEEELAMAFSAMDLVATPYPPVIGSASIVIRAAVAERMVLTSDTGWNGYIVPTFGLGDMASVNDLSAFATCLEGALERASDFVPSVAARQFAEFNRAANVQAHWSSLLRQQTGLPAHPATVEWHGSSIGNQA